MRVAIFDVGDVEGGSKEIFGMPAGNELTLHIYILGLTPLQGQLHLVCLNLPAAVSKLIAAFSQLGNCCESTW